MRQSGLAVPPVILIFGSFWLFPLITALVAGDIVAAEDHNGTLKTILTRSVGRGQVFAAKVLAALTYALVALLAMGLIVARGSGVLQSGFHPLVTLSGTTVGPAGARAARREPRRLRAAAARRRGDRVLLSTVTHNSAAAVVGALMISLLLQLIGILPGSAASSRTS